MSKRSKRSIKQEQSVVLGPNLESDGPVNSALANAILRQEFEKEQHSKHDDTHAAKPLGEGSPKKDTGCELIQSLVTPITQLGSFYGQ